MLKVLSLKKMDVLVLGLVFALGVSFFMVRSNLQTAKTAELVFYPAQEVVVKPVAKAMAQPKAQAIIKPLPAPKIAAAPITPPQVIFSVLPKYPASALKEEVAGTTLLKVQVLANGKAGEVLIAESSGSEILDQTAGKAMLGWTFTPAKQGAASVVSWFEIPIKFVLND